MGKRIWHGGLGAYRVVKGQSQYDVDMKAAAQEMVWANRWQARVRAHESRDSRAGKLAERQLNVAQAASAKDLAREQTKELEEARAEFETLLKQSLLAESTIDFDELKDKSKYSKPKPTQPAEKNKLAKIDSLDQQYQPLRIDPVLSIVDRLIPSRKARKLTETEAANRGLKAQAAQRLADAVNERKRENDEIEVHNNRSATQYRSESEDWQKQKAAFLALQLAQHGDIDDFKASYLASDPEAITRYIEEVLSRSEYPDAFPKEHNFEYDTSTRSLILDYELPNRETLPTIKEVKYIATRQEFQEVPLPESWAKKVYDNIRYQIVLRTVYELFTSDKVDALVSIVFNGWVRSIDRSTGSLVHACVLSFDVRKDEYLAINLNQVDPKACFKKLKGVSASKLIELAPVKPIAALNKNDSRFVESYSVVSGIDDRTNLASMDWLDFENLIREVFEKEFSKGGGEVRITQASRDGGVDAVAFDPDPIRGGKIVIQAKRYTNTVGVSAVRDLYGTVHNEGANKGILVTTSDFGPEAYGFAKDKPLTLISGAELLYLLGKHGHQAKIDLAEAKRIAADLLKR